MSELLRRAGEHFATEQASRRQAEEQQATRDKRAAKQLAELNRVGRQRAQEFVGIMATRRVATTPLYAHVYRHVPDVLRDRNQLVSVPKLGEGWLIRPYEYRYDEDPVRGLLLTDDCKLYECGELERPFSESRPSNLTIRDPKYYGTGMRYETDSPVPDRIALLGAEDGMDILARGLVLNGVTG